MIKLVKNQAGDVEKLTLTTLELEDGTPVDVVTERIVVTQEDIDAFKKEVDDLNERLAYVESQYAEETDKYNKNKSEINSELAKLADIKAQYLLVK